jgi:hypothetical protein
MSSVQHPTMPMHDVKIFRGDSSLIGLYNKAKLDVQSDVCIAHLSPNSSQDMLLFQERHQAHIHA